MIYILAKFHENRSRTFFRMASKNRLISKGAWHSLVPSLSFMSHLTSMLNPHVSSIFVNASSRVGKGSWSSSTSVNSLTPFEISFWIPLGMLIYITGSNPKGSETCRKFLSGVLFYFWFSIVLNSWNREIAWECGRYFFPSQASPLQYSLS